MRYQRGYGARRLRLPVLGLMIIVVGAIVAGVALDGSLQQRGQLGTVAAAGRVMAPRSEPPIVPAIDATLKARLRAILAAGASQGNRAAVFAKIGDSISESGSYLQDLGCGGEVLGDYGSLTATIDYFRATSFPANMTSVWCGTANSFSRASVSAVAGWSADYALSPLGDPVTGCEAPYNTPLKCELHLVKPSMALIMYGTNDLERYNNPAAFRTQLTTIVEQSIAAGVIPILSTIPPRFDQSELGPRVATYNSVIKEVAAAQQVPLVNYWLALQAPNMIGAGVSEDGIHPSVYNCPPCISADFSTEALRYGYNMRNLTAIQAFDKVKRVVLDDGPADTGGAAPTATTNAPPAVTVTLTATSVATPANCGANFTDVHNSDYFAAGVSYLVGMGAVSGYTDCTFRPYQIATRGQLAKIVVLAEQFSLVTPDSPTFSDVPANNPFFSYVETAAARSIVGGYSDHTFRPYNEITRGQLAKIIVTAEGWSPIVPGTPSFADVSPANPFYGPIETAAARGIINGYSVSEGLVFRPYMAATRGHIAKIVHLARTTGATAPPPPTATGPAQAGINVATNGEDSDSCGAIAAPCRTIAMGIGRAMAGQAVLVHAGTYQENWLEMKSGMSLVSADGPLTAKIYSQTWSAVRLENINGATLDGFEIYGDWNMGDAGDGLVRVLNATNITVRNSLLHDAPFDQDVVKVSGRVSGLLLENLVVYNPGTRAAAEGDCAANTCFQENIDIYGSDAAPGDPPPASDIIVRGCWLFHTPERGGDWLIYTKINAENVLYENNIFGPSAGLGWHNPAVGIGTGEAGEPDDRAYVVNHAIVRNNVFTGLKGDAAFAVQNSDDVWVYNNTFYGNGGDSLRAVIEFRGNSHQVGAVSLFNNIFAGNTPAAASAAFYWMRDEAPTSFFHDYNLYSNNVAASDISYSDEAHSLYSSDALLAAPAVPDITNASPSRIAQIAASFSLGANSPALDRGIDAIAQPGHPNWKIGQTDRRQDITGNTRPSGNTWDLGAHER